MTETWWRCERLVHLYIHIICIYIFHFLTHSFSLCEYIHACILVCTFNILHGFPEALVRGMRSSFLKDSDYHHLTQCETLDDVRLNMTESDYNECIADSATMTPASLQKSAILKVRRSLYRYTRKEAQRVVFGLQ